MKNKGKWALITGASGGIGSALVDVFLKNGYRVIGTDRHSPTDAASQATQYIQLDLETVATSEEYTAKFCKDIIGLTKGEGIHALINNAAIQHLGTLDCISRSIWQETLNVNLSAPLFLIQALSGSLTKNDGSVVNISSIHATQTKPEFVAYATSKSALSALTRNLAVSIGASIRVNAIEPAAVGTKMLKDGFEGASEKLDDLHAYHPAGRIADPAEIAELALFLCSDNASFIHGECVSISGGINSRLYDPC
jgi:NAD(P)-dependent dehydrogenase (short-subunit alcohol dehydrogenase family)